MSGATSSPTRADPRTRIQAMADELSASCDGCPVAIMVRETDVDALRLAAHVGVGPQVRSRLGPAFLESSAVGQAVDAASAGTQVRLQGALFDWLAAKQPAAEAQLQASAEPAGTSAVAATMARVSWRHGWSSGRPSSAWFLVDICRCRWSI